MKPEHVQIIKKGNEAIKKWREENSDEIIDLRYYNPISLSRLQGLDLFQADIRYAILNSTDLRGTNLSETDISASNLQSSDLRGADLTGANLTGSNLDNADLRGADLQYANLTSASLRNVNLIGTNLFGADLIGVRGIYVLKINDTHNNVVYAQVCQGVLMIGSGCHYFTVAQALTYWGPNYRGFRRIGELYIKSLNDDYDFQTWVTREYDLANQQLSPNRACYDQETS